jgi:hypothetical protein
MTLPQEPGEAGMARTYTLVVLTEALVITALWLFQRAFT